MIKDIIPKSSVETLNGITAEKNCSASLTLSLSLLWLE